MPENETLLPNEPIPVTSKVGSEINNKFFSVFLIIQLKCMPNSLEFCFHKRGHSFKSGFQRLPGKLLSWYEAHTGFATINMPKQKWKWLVGIF